MFFLLLTICILGNFPCFARHLLTFFKINFFFKFLSRTPSECQTVWIKIWCDTLSVLIRVQIVCKGYQQTTNVATSKERVNRAIRPGPRGYKKNSCSTQLSTKFQQLVNTKIPTNKEVSCFVSQMLCLSC